MRFRAMMGPLPIYVSERLLEPGSISRPEPRRLSMMKWRHWVSINTITLLTLVFVTALPACGQETDQMIDKALKNSGITGQLEHLHDTVISSIPDDAFPDRRIKRETGEFLKETAGKEVLLPLVRGVVKENLDVDKMQTVLKFYDSKVGRKVGRLQESALEPNLISELKEKRALLATLNESRVATLERIVAAERVPEASSSLINAIIEGLVEGYSDEVSRSERPNEESRKQIRIALKEATAGSNRSRELALLGLAHTLRPVNDKELLQFAAFCDSEAGVWFNTSVQKGLQEAVTKTGRALGIAVARWRLHTEKINAQKGRQNPE
jgi:hypothetical protein